MTQEAKEKFQEVWESQKGCLMFKEANSGIDWKQTIAWHFFCKGMVDSKGSKSEHWLLGLNLELKEQRIHANKVLALEKEERSKLTTKVTKLKRQLKAEKLIVDLVAQEEVNGYAVVKMLGDVKQISIKHGGFQNAYALSHIIETIHQARTCQSQRKLLP